MGNNITEHGRQLALKKAEKRASALRENLKRRKISEAARELAKGEKDEKPEDSQ